MSIESLRVRMRDWLNAPTKEEAAELAEIREGIVDLNRQMASMLPAAETAPLIHHA